MLINTSFQNIACECQGNDPFATHALPRDTKSSFVGSTILVKVSYGHLRLVQSFAPSFILLHGGVIVCVSLFWIENGIYCIVAGPRTTVRVPRTGTSVASEGLYSQTHRSTKSTHRRRCDDESGGAVLATDAIVEASRIKSDEKNDKRAHIS
jgi:hypothetical protein